MLGNNRYGKANVKFLRVVKDSPTHVPHEFVGQIMLHGPFETAFTAGSVLCACVATAIHSADRHQRNHSAHRDPKEHAVRPVQALPDRPARGNALACANHSVTDEPQRWVVLAARDVMKRHTHVTAVDMDFSRLPWERMVVEGKPHNHAFIRGAGSRFVRAHVPRSGPVKLVAGFRGVRVMKTTQSGFEGFIVDEFTTLKPTRDRVMATEISCEYTFVDGTDIERTPFGVIADSVRTMTLERFAGPADKGVYSASVQQTIHQIGTAVLDKYAVVASISFALPNIHFYAVDFADFKGANLANDKEVFLTFDGAHGQIEATIQRKPVSKL